MNSEKYMLSREGGDFTYSLMLRKLISIYSDTNYESIFDFNDTSIDIKYKNILLRFWEERNGKVEKLE